jgi:hypothetical protein
VGYWAEMIVNGYVFDISIDGINMSRELDTADHQALGIAAVQALRIYSRFYPIIEALNSGQSFDNEQGARRYLKRLGDTSSLARAKLYIEALQFNGVSVQIPEEISLVIQTAWMLSESPRREGISGYVYLLKSSSGYWKIGKTVDPDNRLQTFSVKLPFEVEYEHLIPCKDHRAAESGLHRRFDAKRVNGEWFDLSPADVTYIKSISFL